MSGNAHSPSFLPNNVNFNRPIAYNGSPVIKGNLRSDPSLNENGKGDYGQFDHMRNVMGRSYPSEMWPSQPMRYGISANFKNDFSTHGYNFPKLVQDEFMGQGYQQGFKMPCNEFLPYPPSHSQMMPASQPLPPLTRIPTDVQHPSSEILPPVQGSSDKFTSESRSVTMSPPQFYSKSPKCGDQNAGKKSQENPSPEDMDLESDVGGGNSSRSLRSSSPGGGRSMHPTPPSTGCSNSRSNTPSQSAGLMPPPLNPNQSRVFSPGAMNNSGFYPQHFHMGGFNRPGGPSIGQEHPQFGSFSYPHHPSTLMRSSQHSYRMREPHFADIRHYQSQARMLDGRFDNDQEYLRHNYRHSIMPTRVPPPAMMYGHMGDFQPRSSYEGYNSSHDPSIPSVIQHRKFPGDLDFEKSALERNYPQKHGHFPHQMSSIPSPFSTSTSSKSPHLRDEMIDSRAIQVGSPNPTHGKYPTSKSTKHNVEGEEFSSNLPTQPSFMTGNPPSQELSNRSPWQPNKEASRQSELFDDHSSTQDTFEENKHTSDSLVTDESNTSDTLLSYPGTSLHSQNENSNMEEPIFESPHKKLKEDFSQRPFQDNARFNKNEAFCKLLEMGGESDRHHFVQDFFSFMESRQTSFASLPTISKQPIDLFKLFCIVRKFGGMMEVTKEKKWRDISGILNMGPSSSAGFVLKKNYGKYLFPYECYHDQQANNDQLPMLSYVDQPGKKSVNKRPEISSFDNPEYQNSPKMSENISSTKNFQSPGLYMPQSAMSLGSGQSSGGYDHSAYVSDNSTFPAHAPRFSKYPTPSNFSNYDHLQMICPSSPSVKVEKRVIGSHIQKELLFPSSSVESTRPKCIKRKRLGFKQIGQVDAWHVVMSLKSGLICETAWALNILTGLLGDDLTSSFFCLQSMPGLIEILLDHFRASLVALFGKKFEDLELDWSERGEHLNGSCKELSDSTGFKDHNKQYENSIFMGRREYFKDEIKLDKNSNEEMWLTDKKLWDREGFGEFESSAFDWHLGRGGCSKHILVNVESFINKDFLSTKYFDQNSSRYFKNKDRNLRNEESMKTGIKNETLEPISPLDHNKEFTIKKESVKDSETSICNHKICGDIRDCHPNLCLQHSYLKSRDDWFCAESRNDKNNFNLLPETFCEQERKCLQVSNIFRSLSFIPGNDSEMSKHSGLLATLARLMVLEHNHELPKEAKVRNVAEFEPSKLDDLLLDRNPQEDFHCPSRTTEMLREDALVILANISGQLDLSLQADEVCSPILDGILHWTTCFTTAANDCNTFSSLGQVEPGNVVPSFAMLALETSSKLCVLDSNVDLIMATPPFSRIVTLIHRLSEFLSSGAVGDHQEEDSPMWMTDQIAREFSLVILSSFVQTYPSCAHLLAINQNLIGTLLNFIEVQCTKMHVATSSSTTPSYGNCSPDMLKRAVVILHRIFQIKSKCEEERRSLLRHKDRLLDLLCHRLPKSNSVSDMVGDILSCATF